MAVGKIDFSKLKRNPKAIQEKLFYKEEYLVAKDEITILIPNYYIKKKLAENKTNGIDLIAVFPILDAKGNYGVLANTAKVSINYGRYESVTVGDVVYDSYTFERGEVIMNSARIVKNSDILFEVFNTFFLNGKIPSFLTYSDVSKLFDFAQELNDSRVGDYPVIVDLLVSSITRIPMDMRVPFKDTINTESDLAKPVKYIGIDNVEYAVTNNGSRMISGYFDQNMNTMILTTENKHVKEIDALRK